MVPVLALGAPLATDVVSAAANETAGNETVSAPGTGPYNLTQLRDGGTQPSNAPPSVRPQGDQNSFWLRHVPTGLFQSADDESARQYLSPGTTINRDQVYLGAFRGWESEQTTVEVTIVYWEEGTVERQTENGVVRETAAVNQTVETVEVTLAGGDYAETVIDLRSNYDDKEHVTMWIEGEQGTVQWTFQHKTSQAAKNIALDSRGDAISWAAWMFLLPGFATAIAFVAFDRRLLDRAGAGPQLSIIEYGLVAFGLLIAGGFMWFDGVIQVTATQPWVLGVAGGLVVGLITVEIFGDRTSKVGFLRFDLEESQIHEDGSGVMEVEFQTKKMVNLPDGKAIVRRGIRRFIARARGAVPMVDWDGDPKTNLEATEDSDVDELYLVDPLADEAVDHESPTWSIDVIEWRDDEEGLMRFVPRVDVVPVSIAAAGVMMSWAIGKAWFNSGAFGTIIGFIGGLAYLATPNARDTVVNLAPAHYDSVIANMLQQAEGFEEQADREYYKNEYYSELGSNLAERKSEQENAEMSRMEAVMDEFVPDDATENGDDEGVTVGDD
jgi:hypothetical protein